MDFGEILSESLAYRSVFRNSGGSIKWFDLVQRPGHWYLVGLRGTVKTACVVHAELLSINALHVYLDEALFELAFESKSVRRGKNVEGGDAKTPVKTDASSKTNNVLRRPVAL